MSISSLFKLFRSGKSPVLRLSDSERTQYINYFHKQYDQKENYDITEISAYEVDQKNRHIDKSDLAFIQKMLEGEGLNVPSLSTDMFVTMDDPWDAEVLIVPFKSLDNEDLELIYSLSYSSATSSLAKAFVVPVEWELNEWPKLREKALEFFLEGRDTPFSPQAEKELMTIYCESNKIAKYTFWFDSFFPGKDFEQEIRVSAFAFASLL